MKGIISLAILVILLNIPLSYSIQTSLLSQCDTNKIDDNTRNSPWPMFSHDIRHTGRGLYDTSDNLGIEKWRCETGLITRSSPAIGNDGTIYIGSEDHYLHAISLDGIKKWSFMTDNRVRSSPAVADDGTIYISSWDGHIYSVNPNGTLKWMFNCYGPIKSSPIIGLDGTLYLGVIGPGQNMGRIYSIYSNGTEKWHYETNNGIYSSPALGEDATVYIGSNDGYLYAIKSDGTLKWRFRIGDFVQSSPTIADDGTIYVGSSYVGSVKPSLYALYPNGTLRWSFKPDGSWREIHGSPAVAEDGTIYVGTGEGKLYAINPDGRKKWSLQLTPGTFYPIYSSPSVGKDGTIFVGGMDGKLYAVTPLGALKWSFNFSSDKKYDGCSIESSPAVGEYGIIYIGSWFYSSSGDFGYLHAIGGVPSIKIIEPRQGFLYIGFRELGPTLSGRTFIIGRVTFKVSVFNEQNVEKVEFYFDDRSLGTVNETPFAIMVDETSFWKHIIKAKAYYIDGTTPSDEMEVIIFNI